MRHCFQKSVRTSHAEHPCRKFVVKKTAPGCKFTSELSRHCEHAPADRPLRNFTMDNEGTRYQRPVRPGAEKLEDRYGKIAIPAVAAAVRVGRKEPDARQMNAEAQMTRLQQMAQS
jgi:hypothetical protein